MAITSYTQWRFPTVQTYDGHAIGIRINRIAYGAPWPSNAIPGSPGSNYNGQGVAGSIATLKAISPDYLNFASLISHIGPLELTKHDPDGDLCMPKKDFELTDTGVITGVDDTLATFSYDLYNSGSSLNAEIFQDPSATYEIWLTDYSGPIASPVTEIYFKGEIDYNAVQWQHENIANPFGTTGGGGGSRRLLHAKFSANSAIISLKQKPSATGVPSNRTAQDLVNYVVNNNLRDDIVTAYIGSGTPEAGTLTPYALSYDWSHSTAFPRATSLCRVPSILEWISTVAEFQGSSIDSNMMFDFYGQSFQGSPNYYWPISKIDSLIGHTATWDDLYVEENFLFGMPITDNPLAFNGMFGVGTGTNSFTDTHFTGTFSGFNTFAGIVGQTLEIDGVGSYTVISVTSASTIVVSGIVPVGTGYVWKIVGYAYADLFIQWPCSVPRDSTLDKLVTWICLQTGCYADYEIDNTTGNEGKFYVRLKARRSHPGSLPSAWIPLTGTSEEPTQVGKSSLIVQMIGDNLQALVGPNKNDAITLSPPWRCHKWGTPVINGGDSDGSHGPEFAEYFYDTTLGDQKAQSLGVTTDKKSGDYFTVTQDPTDVGWLGGAMLLYKMSGYNAYPSDTVHAPTSGPTYWAVAAIMPAGLTPPTDEWLTSPAPGSGSYFQPTTAYGQFYFQEIVGNKIVMKQRFRGCRGDDGKLQSVKPNMLMETWLRGAHRKFISHALNIHEIECITEVTWVEILDHLTTLPTVATIGQAGSSSSTASSTSPIAGGGGGTLNGAILEVPGSAFINTVTPAGDFDDLTLTNIGSKTSNYLSIRNSGGTLLSRISKDGTIYVQPTTDSVPFTGKIQHGDTSHLIDLGDSSAADLFHVTATGKAFSVGADVGSQLITNVLYPSATTDAANKQYVIDEHSEVAAGTGIAVAVAGIVGGGTLYTISTTGGGFTNPMTTLGDIIYEDATPAPARLAGNTNNRFEVLSSTATGGVAQAPAWSSFVTDYGTLHGTFLGNAGSASATGSENIGIGWQALLHLTSGAGNVGIGSGSPYGALGSLTTGNCNVAVGQYALYQITTASNNTALGVAAGYNILGGSAHDNVFIGYAAGNNTPSSVTNSHIEGTVGHEIKDVYFGAGDVDGSGNAGTSYAIHGTGGNGTNLSGGNITIAGGKATGNGTGGIVKIQASLPGLSGSTPQNLSDVAMFDHSNGFINNRATTFPVEIAIVTANATTLSGRATYYQIPANLGVSVNITQPANTVTGMMVIIQNLDATVATSGATFVVSPGKTTPFIFDGTTWQRWQP